ncbi:uncharacterized protein V6R79_002954 [Siganus canaliculatus]
MDNVSNFLAIWEKSRNTTREEDNVFGFVLLLSWFAVLGVVAFLFLFSIQYKKVTVLFSGKRFRLKGFQDVHTFFFALLTMDAIHVVVAIIYAISLSENCLSLGERFCLFVHGVWIVSRYFMVILHLFMALKSLNFLYDPSTEGNLHCMAPLIFVLFFLFDTFYEVLTFYLVVILAVVVIGLAFAIVLKGRFSGMSNWRIPIVILAMISFLVVFLPSFFFHCLIIKPVVDVTASAYLYFQFATDIQLFLDVLLCFFVMKMPVEEELKHPPSMDDSAVQRKPVSTYNRFESYWETPNPYGGSSGDTGSEDGDGGGRDDGDRGGSVTF